MEKKNKYGFTFIEILVVVTIISLLTFAGLTSYTGIIKKTRDTKRISDIEQIRAAVEMYRNNNENFSYPVLSLSCSKSGSIKDGSNIYLATIPRDPSCKKNGTGRSYTYLSYDSSGESCDGTSEDPCVDYIIAAALEIEPVDCDLNLICGEELGSPVRCTYCVGPYGKK